MRRIWFGTLALALLLGAALVLGAAGAALAQGEDPPPPLPPPSKAKPFKRVVHAIELATSKKEKFTGNITLRIASGHDGTDLKYYWGGKCKGTKLSASRLSMLMTAMEKGYAVEIPAEPINYEGRIYMCMTSMRILHE